MKRVLAVGAGVLVVGAAAGAFALTIRGSTDSYDTPTELGAALRAEGVPCDNPSMFENDTPGIDQTGSCAAPSGDYFLFVFDDPGRAQDEVKWDFRPLRDQDPSTPDWFVVGSNWIVSTHSGETAELVRDALGGEIHR